MVPARAAVTGHGRSGPIVAAAGGAVVGFLMVVWFPLGARVPAEVSAPPPSPAPVLELPPACEDQHYLEGEITRLRQEAEALGETLEETLGSAEPWPDDVPAALRPHAVRATLAALLETTPELSLEDLDCTGYPCLAVLRYTWPDPEAHSWPPEELDLPNGHPSITMGTHRFYLTQLLFSVDHDVPALSPAARARHTAHYRMAEQIVTEAERDAPIE